MPSSIHPPTSTQTDRHTHRLSLSLSLSFLLRIVLVDIHTHIDIRNDLNATIDANPQPLLLLPEDLGGLLLVLGRRDGHVLERLLVELLLALGAGQFREAPLLAAAHPRQQMAMGVDEAPVAGELDRPLARHAAPVEDALAPGPDLGDAPVFLLSCVSSYNMMKIGQEWNGLEWKDALHSLERLLHQLAVVAHGDVAARGELQGAVDDHLLAGGLPERLGPLQLSRVSLHLELCVCGRGCQFTQVCPPIEIRSVRPSPEDSL